MPHAFRRHALFLGIVAAVAGAAAVSAIAPPAHHRGGRFQNNYLDFQPKGIGQLIKWRIAAAREQLPRPPRLPTPRVDADLGFIRSNGAAGAAMVPALTWIDHASTLVQAGGSTLLTDPMFSARASPFSFVGPKRQVAPGIALADLPHIDAVLISHNHYDHLDAPSVRALAAQAAARRSSSCRSASRPGWPISASPTPSSSTGGRARTSARSRSSSRRRSTGRGDRWATGWRRCGAATPSSRPRSSCSSPATPPTRRTSPTSTSASPRATVPDAASTSR